MNRSGPCPPPRRRAAMMAVSRRVAACAVALLSAATAQSPEQDGCLLSLREAVRRALAGNFKLQAAALEPEIAAQAVRVEQAAFDPAWFAQSGIDSSDRPLNTRELLGTGVDPDDLQPGVGGRVFSEDVLSYGTGITGRLPFGTRYEFSLKGNRLKNDLNREIPPSLFYPEYDAFLGLTLTQPLLRGGGSAVNQAPLRVAEEDARIAVLDRNQAAEDTGLEVAVRYCDLVFALGDIGVKRESVELAAALQQVNEQLLEQGVGSIAEVTEAAAAVAFRGDELEQARAVLIQAQAELLKLMGAEAGWRPLPSARGVLFAVNRDPATMIGAALVHRLDYQKALAEVRKQDIELRYARNQKWPQLDLKATAGLLGLDERFNGAFSEAVRDGNAAWGIGLQLTVPLGGREADARIRAADLRKLQALLGVKRIEQEIAIDIESQLRAVALHQRRIGLARTAAQLARTRVEQEVRRLEEGTTTSFAVLQMQRDLAAALTQELAASCDYNRAAARISHVQGTLLRALGFESPP